MTPNDPAAAGDAAHAAAEAAARNSYGRLVAFLAARTRDLAGAEDALADAFAAALRRWPVDGVPASPDAWLLTAARRRQTDSLRRRLTHRAGEAHLSLMAEEMADEIDIAAQAGGIPDRRLALMFACAHPAVERGIRSPLILQTVLGLSADSIAAAFLLPPATMSQRLVRAKARIRDAGIPFRIPEREELPERLDAVLEAIYAAYTRGWGDIGDSGAGDLASEAIWLGRLTVALIADAAEAEGMLALMLYTEARRQARRGPDGAYIPFEQQDTSLWAAPLIDEAERLLHAANGHGASGRYQLEAAIQSAHIARRLTGIDTWPAVVSLYDHLLTLTASPVVALNRAIALAEVDGPLPGLAAIEAVAGDSRMANYQPFWAARGALLAKAGHSRQARDALARAISLSTDAAIRDYLTAQRDRLSG